MFGTSVCSPQDDASATIAVVAAAEAATQEDKRTNARVL
jgi:hypothetical protein